VDEGAASPGRASTAEARGRTAVPIYEFSCRKCGADFTLALTLKEYEKTGAVCPKCKATDVERVYSTLQVITSRKS
jgi:putative FmdB family regulatory protein